MHIYIYTHIRMYSYTHTCINICKHIQTCQSFYNFFSELNIYVFIFLFPSLSLSLYIYIYICVCYQQTCHFLS